MRRMGSRRITCPDCAAAYDVPQAHARPGRQVRCAACGTQWAAFDEAAAVVLPMPAAEPAATVETEALTGSRSIAASLKQHSLPVPAVDEDTPEAGPDASDWADAELPDFASPHNDLSALPQAPFPEAAPPSTLPQQATGARAAWVASVLLLVVVGFGGVHWRAPIMLGWPPSTRLYAMFGTPHMPRAATADSVAPAAASAISNSPSMIRPPGVSE